MNPKDRAGAKKPNLSVLPFAPLLDVIPALYEGRRKYGPWNWRAEEVSETIYADAAIRHLMQFISGEDIDPDSGVHHISKAIAGLLVVRDAQIHGCSIDDRYVNQDLQIDKQIEQLAGVNERYPEPVESALPPRPSADLDDALDTLRVTGKLDYRQVDEFDTSVIHIGDTVVFVSGERGEVNDIDEESGADLPINVKTDSGTYHWYSANGQVNCHEKGVKKDYEKIVTIVSGNIHQTRLRFDLGKPTCGLEVKTDGGIQRWSATKAGGGSYELTPEDVGKTVILRNGEEGKIGIWDEDSIWPARVGVNGVLITNCSYAGCSSSRCDSGVPYVTEELDYDVVKVYHQ